MDFGLFFDFIPSTSTSGLTDCQVEQISRTKYCSKNVLSLVYYYRFDDTWIADAILQTIVSFILFLISHYLDRAFNVLDIQCSKLVRISYCTLGNSISKCSVLTAISIVIGIVFAFNASI